MKRPLPPWMHRPNPFFIEQQRGNTQGNEGENHAQYNSSDWVKYRRRALAQPEHMHCACGCGGLSTVLDHIIPVTKGGSFWDVRNHQGMKKKCHDRKSGRERHGKVEDSINTTHGRIPVRNAHLPFALGNQTSMIR